MSRKFENGVQVILSNPRTKSTKAFVNQTFTVVGYQRESSWPYTLASTTDSGRVIIVRANEITLAPVTETVVETVTEEELPSTVDVLRSSEKKNVGQLAMQNLLVGDKVLVTFKPTKEQAVEFGVTEQLSHWNSYTSKDIVGKEGIIVDFSHVHGDNSTYVRVRFEEGNFEWLPSVSLLVIEKGEALFGFPASVGHVYCTVYKDKVQLDYMHQFYSFGLFERVWEFIKKHKKERFHGYDRRITLENDWSGEVHDDYIQVGCQRFPYENVRRLVALTRKVKAMQK